MKDFFKMIFGMFLGSDGILSSTKLAAFFGYSLFLVVSVWIAINSPEKFNYEIFAILTAASSTTMRMIDKWLNVKSATQAVSAIVEADSGDKSE